MDASFHLKFDQMCICHCEGGCLGHALLDSDIKMPSLMQHKEKPTVTLLVNNTVLECLEQSLGHSFGNWCQQLAGSNCFGPTEITAPQNIEWTHVLCLDLVEFHF